MEIRHSPDFASVLVGEKLFVFTASQALVVRELWAAMEHGTPVVSDAHLLNLADSDATFLRDLFRRHPAWNTLIVSAGRGLRRLSPELVHESPGCAPQEPSDHRVELRQI